MSLQHSPSIVRNGLICYLDPANYRSFGNNLITSPVSYAANQTVTITDDGQYKKVVSGQDTSSPGIYPIGGNITVLANTNYFFEIEGYKLADASNAHIFIYGATQSANIAFAAQGTPTLTTTNSKISFTFNTGSNTQIRVGVLFSGPLIGSTMWVTNPRLYSLASIIDLSGNLNNGTLVGGATFNSVNNGVIVLNGSNGYIDITLNLSASAYTVIGAARYVTNPGGIAAGRTFSAKNNNWLMGHWNGTTQNYYADNWVSGVGTGPADLSWRTYAATGNPTLDTWQLYVNGISSVGPNANGTSGPNNFSIGTYSGAEFSNSHIGAFLVYNRVLTAAEILQNHNALKGRYSL